MARTIEETLAIVKANNTRTGSLIADRAALKTRVEELLAGQGAIPAVVQAGLDEIFDLETADAAAIDAALNANVPPPEPTPTEPQAFRRGR